MRKKISTLVLAGATLLASCSQEDMIPNGTESGLQPVTLSVSLDNGVQTRAANSAKTRAANAQGDEQVSRCLVQILDSEGNPIEGYSEAQSMAGSEADGFSKTVVLNEENTYTLLFWADRGEGSYAATDLTNVSKVGTDATLDIAYAAKSTWNVNSGRSISATLKHVVSKLTVHTTAAVASGTLKIEVSKVYSGYNVQTMQPGTEIALSYEKTLTDVPENTDVYSIYALTATEAQNLKLTYNNVEETVSNVPLAPNTHTILKGNVNEIGGNLQVTMTATIDAGWNDETEKDWDKETGPKVGDYYYKDGTYSTENNGTAENPIIGVVYSVDNTKKTAGVISLTVGSNVAWATDVSRTGITYDYIDKGLNTTNEVLEYISANAKDITTYPIFKLCRELRTETGNQNWYIPTTGDIFRTIDTESNEDLINTKINAAGGTKYTKPTDRVYVYWLSPESESAGQNNKARTQNTPVSGGTLLKSTTDKMHVRFFLDFKYE